jgi:filamentous hemagglutinin family protein
MKLRTLKKHSLLTLCTTISLFAASQHTAFAATGATGGSIQTGSGSIDQSVANETNVQQNSNYLKIHWDKFSTAKNETVNFNQPKNGVVLNKVTGVEASILRGKLNANGTVILQNEHGITFMPNSQTNVGSLLATTSPNLEEKLDAQGSLIGVASTGNDGNGAIDAQGTINVSDKGFAVLVAPYVSTSSKTPAQGIYANLGTIELASATNYTLDLQGDNLITYQVSKSPSDTKLGVNSKGNLVAKGGAVHVSSHTAKIDPSDATKIIQSTINLSGIVDASSFTDNTNGGNIQIEGTGAPYQRCQPECFSVWQGQ